MKTDSVSSYGRILSADGEAQFQSAVVDYLEDSGFTMYEAKNGEEALAVFRDKKPDLVLSSIAMPGIDGLSLLETIKRESPETPVVIVADSHATDDLIEALRLGAQDYVLKPVASMTVLEHAVCRALESGRLVTENKKYRQELEAKNIQLADSLDKLKEDQEAGKSVQQQLLPKSEMDLEGHHFTYRVIPSLYLSGDFVDYFKISKDKLVFYIADVSGHGASSAFVTVLLKSFIEKMVLNYEMEYDDFILFPEKVLKLLSDEILKAKLGKYLTMVYGVIDTKQNKLVYSVGGHCPNPLIWDGQKSNFLPGRGFAVGIFNGATYEQYEYPLPKAYQIAMFSDGIFEIMKGKDLEAKEKELLSLMDKPDVTVTDMLLALGVSPETSYPDDISLIMVRKG
ncbi:MAG: PP2C family protein-serine/threonine phosphatase [Candidatus Berkiella sp.]